MKLSTRQNRIKKYLKNIFNLSPAGKDPYFSWHPCELCRETLGGDRYDFIGRYFEDNNVKEIIELSCCVDCFEYLFT